MGVRVMGVRVMGARVMGARVMGVRVMGVRVMGVRLPFVALDRDERSAIPHELRQVCRLAPRGRAQVEDRLTGGRRGEQRDELRCHVLHAPRAARKPYRTRGYMGRPAVKESEGRRGRRRGGEGDSRGRGGRGGGPAGAQGLGRPNVGVPGSCGTAPPPEGRSSAPGTSPTRSATMPAALISASTVSTSATSGLTRIASAGRSWCARAHASSSSKSCRCVARSSASSPATRASASRPTYWPSIGDPTAFEPLRRRFESRGPRRTVGHRSRDGERRVARLELILGRGQRLALARDATQHRVHEALPLLPLRQVHRLVHRRVVGRAHVEQLVRSHAQRDRGPHVGLVELGELAECEVELAAVPQNAVHQLRRVPRLGRLQLLARERGRERPIGKGAVLGAAKEHAVRDRAAAGGGGGADRRGGRRGVEEQQEQVPRGRGSIILLMRVMT
eukprot:747237-Prymnesium_polylepis.1